ncbi:hypothetical protein HDC94_001181 [Leifsonia sp. AK011]|uniref:Ig-like domain-containing protein n=1 Tax=Leifsonia sp. AK011 TaxID=2723075 RepID=UPI0015CDAD8C|nr:Ig-like domain-containing protein [Leifsonia sp. AK011]NYF10025.1 hypothetical protein [Leifsonia sp. AK011]
MARSRIAASCAALALIGATIFAGALPAAAYVPAAPTIAGPYINDALVSVTTDATAPTLGGTMQHADGATEVTTVYVSSDYEVSWQPYCSVWMDYFEAANPELPWACAAEVSMAPGTYSFRARTVDSNDETSQALAGFSPTVSYVVGSSSAPTIVSPEPGASTQDATPTFSGYGPVPGTVTVTADGSRTLCTAETVAPDGLWECTSTDPLESYRDEPLAYGITYSVAASAVDADGAPTEPSAAQDLTLEMPDAATLYQSASPWYTTNPQLPITGALTPDTNQFYVWRYVPDEFGGAVATPYCMMSTDLAGGEYTCDPAADNYSDFLVPGVNQLRGSSFSEAGTQSFLGEPIFVTLVAEPIVETPGPDPVVTTREPRPTFAGTADPMATSVSIEADELEGSLCTAAVTGDSWTCAPSEDLADGSYSYVARTYLPGEGGESVTSVQHVLVVDTVALAPTVTTTGPVQGPSPIISGTGEPGATLTVFLNNSERTCTVPTVVDENGDWTCQPLGELSPGDYTITATQTDLAGNTSSLPDKPLSEITVEVPPAPPAPKIVTPEPGTVYTSQIWVSGTIDATGGYPIRIGVTGASLGGTETCGAVIGPDDFSETGTEWGCYLIVQPGTYSISAVASIDGIEGTTSNTSNVVSLTYVAEVPKPDVDYTLAPASVAFSATAALEGNLNIGWYRVVEGEGEGGIGFDFLDSCGTGEGGGEGGEGFFASLDSDATFAASSAQCGPYGDLAPGLYNAYVTQYGSGETVSSIDDYIMIPSAPTLLSPLVSGTTLTFRGSAGDAFEPGYVVSVQRASGSEVCSSPVDEAGNWTCSATVPVGSESYRAVQQAVDFDPDLPAEWTYDSLIPGFSAYSEPRIATVQAPVVPPAPVTPPAPAPTVEPTPTPTPTETPTPTPTPAPTPTTFSFTIGATSFLPGETTTVSGEGVPGLSQIDAELHSTPVLLGSTTASDAGSFDLTVTIPEDVEPGAHEIVVIVTPPGGEPMQQTKAVTVLSPQRAQATVPAGVIAATSVDRDPATVDRSDPGAPSSLTTSLKTVDSIFDHPVLLGGATLAGLALLLLVALPAELLNSTISENYGRITRSLPKPRLSAWGRFKAWLKITPVFGGILITFVTAFVFGFADPRFGFDVTSLRTFLALGLALLVVGYLASGIAGAIIRRLWRLDTVVELKPMGILLAVIGVIVSRLIDFSPGFLLGLVLGLSVVGSTTAAQRAKATLVQAGTVFVLAMLAWGAYSLLMATTDPNSFGTALAFDTTVAITSEGLTALFIGMLPFKLLNGSSVFEYSKLLWVVSYVVAAAAFVLVVVPSSWGSIDGPLWNWLLVLGIFAAAAIAIYLFFRLTDKEDDGDDASVVENEDAEALEL